MLLAQVGGASGLLLSLVCIDRCVHRELTLGKLSDSSETQFPHLQSEGSGGSGWLLLSQG